MSQEGNVSFPPRSIFEGVSFTVVPSDDLSDHDCHELTAQLTDNGARFVALNNRNGRIDDLSKLTHVVSTSIDFPEYEDAFLQMVHVVKPSWVEISIAKGKATNPRQFSPDPCLVMSGVVLACADIPTGDKEAIHGGLLAMGGQYSRHLTRLCTHIVALTLDNGMCAMALNKNLDCKIVLPHWFDDCLKLQRRIDERPYLLPDPEILHRPQQPINHKLRHYDDVEDAINPSPQDIIPTRRVNGRNSVSVFRDHKLFLSSDLSITGHLRQSLTDLIVQGEGEVVGKVEEASIIVCLYREGSDFFEAYNLNKQIGNLGWLYYLITHNTWISPLRRLLHYPVPRYPLPGFANTNMCLSCYQGEARIYLENLIRAGGGNISKTMTPDNTHLITAHEVSEKCDAAKSWNVNIINHLWLEESYARGKLQALTNQRYTTFPRGTSLGEVVGQTQIDRGLLQELYGQTLTRDPLDDSITQVEQLDGGSAEPLSGPTQPTKSARNSSPVQEVPRTAAKRKSTATDKLKKTRDDNVLKTPAPSRIADGKENETPLSTASRGAKQRATERLHEQSKDIALFQKESKRVGGVTHGKSRSTDSPDTKEPRGKKRQSSHLDEEEGTDRDDEEAISPNDSKRAKTVSGEHRKPSISERLMVTKYQKWDQKESQQAADKNKLRNLGVHITENPAECTILCAPHIVRTRKFVSAIAAAPRIVNTEWLDHALKHNKLPAEDKYLLKDREAEDKLGCKLGDSIDRATRNNGHLLRGWQIFCTEGVTGGYETYKTIIEANGGICSVYKGRLVMQASKRAFPRETQQDEAIADNQGDDEGDTLYLLSEEHPRDKSLWEKFRSLAEKEDMVPKIVTTDWLLAACMRQRVESDGGIYEIKEACPANTSQKGSSDRRRT